MVLSRVAAPHTTTIGAQDGVAIINTLVESDQPQPAYGTPIDTDNSTAHHILTAQVCMKNSKEFIMQYHWMKDRIAKRPM